MFDPEIPFLYVFLPAVLQATGLSEPGVEGHVPPQFLSEQLTLSKPGGQNMSTIVLQAPPDFQTLRRPCLRFDSVSHSFKYV